MRDDPDDDPLDDEGFSPDRGPTPRAAAAFGPERTAAHCEMLANRLRKNLRHVRKWAKRAQVTCYRVYDRDIPEVPLSVDWYDGRVCVAARLRPEERDASDFDAWSEALRLTVARTLEVAPEQVYARERQRQRGAAQYQPQGREAQRFEVVEGGRRLWVNLSDYLDTGLFLDHRPLRARVAAEARGRRVLNLFCYTGAFSVHAAAGGAASTVSVDLSPTYLAWAGRNLARNRLDENRHRLVRADVFEFLRGDRGAYDVVVLDPPTLSRSSSGRSFDLQRAHGELLGLCLARLAPGGELWFSTNYRQFRLDDRAVAGSVVREITAETTPPDFREGLHRSFVLTPR